MEASSASWIIGSIIISRSDIVIWFLMLSLVVVHPSLRRLIFSTTPRSASPPVPAGRSAKIDATRAVAIIAVMGIHALYFPAAAPGLALPEWVSATLMNNSMRFAVPVFLMFSGYCLEPWSSLTTSSQRKNFYLKKIKRIFLPYLAIASSLYIMGHPFSWEGLIQSVLCGSVSPPFYFVIVLGQLYLLYPLLCRLSRHPLPLLLLSLAVSSASYLYLPSQNIADFPTFTAYLFPFVFGMVSRELKTTMSANPKETSPPPPPSGISSYLSMNALVAILIIVGNFPNASVGFYSYNFQFFYAIPVLLLLLRLFSQHPSLAQALAPMGKYSLWIFLLHYPIQELTWKLVSPSSSTAALTTAILIWMALAMLFWVIARCLSCGSASHRP